MSGDNCLSCGEQENEQNERDAKDEDKVLEVCENLYSVAAKCETKHGFQEGLARVKGYENQIANEFDACTFVDSLVFESYNAKGEIEIRQEQYVYDRVTTPYQKGALIGLSFTIIGFVVYTNFLHAEINEGYPTIRSMLLRQGIISEDDSWGSNGLLA